MEFIGMDLASGPDRTVLTFRHRHNLRDGDRLKMFSAPNSHRHYVAACISETAVEVGLHIRPSRGFARHRRRTRGLGQ
jgi:hypothetical protein